MVKKMWQNLPVKIAILDLYDNEPNQGLGCIKEIVQRKNRKVYQRPVELNVFETRYKSEIPGLEHDIYISSGGPGSPFDGEGKTWERKYFRLIEDIWNYNQRGGQPPKFVFFICHSFQMMARFFDFATIQKREKRSFGIIPVKKTIPAADDPIFAKIPEIFYAADFRMFEVVQPNVNKLNSLGAKVLATEKQRRHPDLPKALMAVRLSNEMIGTQFHPEADPISMLFHFRQPERKRQVVDEYGEEKYYEMIAHLEDPENILLTRKLILPRFLEQAIERLTPEIARHTLSLPVAKLDGKRGISLRAANE